MLTPQEVQEKKFAKAVFGGYDMGEVDEFLDTIVNDYEQLYKENALLKGKLKALAEKVEEYRLVDEQMRATLARAKRESDEQIETAKQQAAEERQTADDYAAKVRADADDYSEKLLADAKAKAEDMQNIARAEAMQKLEGIRAEIEQEGRRLADARNATKHYAAEAAEVCKRQLEALRSIVSTTPSTTFEPEEPVAAAFAPQPVEPAPVEPAPTIDEPTVRITGRHAAEDPATAADAAEDIEFDAPVTDVDNEPTIRFETEKQPTIRFDKPRKVDIGGDTVEFGDEDDEQSDDDAFRQIFGKPDDGAND